MRCFCLLWLLLRFVTTQPIPILRKVFLFIWRLSLIFSITFSQGSSLIIVFKSIYNKQYPTISFAEIYGLLIGMTKLYSRLGKKSCLFLLIKKKSQKKNSIINVYKNKKTSRLAYLWLIFLISASILFCMLLVTMKSHHKLADVHKYRRRHLPMNMHHFTKTDVLQNQNFL